MTASTPVHSVRSRPTAVATLRRVPVQGRSMARVQRMLDACAAIMDEVGYDGLTTTLLAERAGVAIGSVYQFFPDKRAVVQALAQRNLARYLERLMARLAGGVDGWWEAVEIAIDEYIQVHRSVPGFRALHLGDVLDGVPDGVPGRGEDPDGATHERVIASQVAGVLLAATEAAGVPRLRFSLSVALQAVDPVIKSAFRRDAHGDKDLLAEATALVRGYLRGGLASANAF